MVTVLAASGAAGGDPTSGLVQYGALGIFAAVAIAALTWFVKQQAAERKVLTEQLASAFQREAARADRNESEIRELNRAHASEIRELHLRNTDTTIPALLAAQEAIKDTQQLVRDLARGARQT